MLLVFKRCPYMLLPLIFIMTPWSKCGGSYGPRSAARKVGAWHHEGDTTWGTAGTTLQVSGIGRCPLGHRMLLLKARAAFPALGHEKDNKCSVRGSLTFLLEINGDRTRQYEVLQQVHLYRHLGTCLGTASKRSFNQFQILLRNKNRQTKH